MPNVTERLKDIQRHLGVSPDGVLGPITLTALEQAVGLGDDTVAPSLIASRRSLDAVVDFEISSAANYRRRLQQPTWPGGASGVTIGIGYDLGHTPRRTIERDWRGQLPDADVDELLSAAGVRGDAARSLVPGLAHLTVPFEPAREVFYTRSLPTWGRRVRRIYPGVELLPADAQGALLSLVFNRGSSLADTPRRREMRQIRPLVAAADLAGIATEIRAMKRLWVGRNLPGLLKRRDDEAEMIEEAERAYLPDELVRV